MHLFADYIQPVTIWLHAHPHWAILFTFLISFTESLAVIGSLIPGSVIMTAIGILAGSGVIRIDLTLIAATAGAIAGDSFSYLIGNVFSERLMTIWPFNHYPALIAYGKDYFSRHGGKSVLIGRFVGPIRAIIPVIAGMMRMPHIRFFVANFVSAILWSFIYIIPGVLIGLASAELSAESATRLFAMVLFSLGGLWLLTIALRWLFIRINQLLRSSLNDLWLRSTRHPHLAKFFKAITPAHESNHYQTASLCLSFLLSLLVIIILTIMGINKSGLFMINQPIHLFLQSIRTVPFDTFFIIISQIDNLANLLFLGFIIAFKAIWQRNYRYLLIWLSLNFFTLVLVLFLQYLINSPHPTGLLNSYEGNSFPNLELTLFTAQICFIVLYLTSFDNTRWTRFFNGFFIVLLILLGFAPLYLGDNWFTDVIAAYCCGFTLSLFHWIIFRKKQMTHIPRQVSGVIITCFIIAGTLISAYINMDQLTRNHQPYLAQYVLTDDLWWNQTKPILPMYRMNRIGKPVTLFNLQYAGSLSHLEATLREHGWKKQQETILGSIAKRFSATPSDKGTPLMAQLYNNRKPTLTMSFQSSPTHPMLILRLWRSNYHLQHFRQPLWLGSVHVNRSTHLQPSSKVNDITFKPLYFVSRALTFQFKQRQIPLNCKKLSVLPLPVEPSLLLIKEEFPLPYNK